MRQLLAPRSIAAQLAAMFASDSMGIRPAAAEYAWYSADHLRVSDSGCGPPSANSKAARRRAPRRKPQTTDRRWAWAHGFRALAAGAAGDNVGKSRRLWPAKDRSDLS